MGKALLRGSRIVGVLTAVGAGWLVVLLVAAPLPPEAWVSIEPLLAGRHDASALLLPSVLPSLLLGICGVLAVTAATWWIVCLCLCLSDEVRRRGASSPRSCPASARRCSAGSWLRPRSAQVLAALAVGGLSVALPAHAQVSDGVPEPVGARSVAGLRLPDRAESPGKAAQVAARPSSTPSAGHTPDPALTHTVRPGESLWSIAAARLTPDASAAAVDRAWRRLYAHNRSRLGPDPDLLRPGVVLTVPATGADVPARPLRSEPVEPPHPGVSP